MKNNYTRHYSQKGKNIVIRMNHNINNLKETLHAIRLDVAGIKCVSRFFFFLIICITVYYFFFFESLFK